MSHAKQVTRGLAWLVSGRFGNALVSAVSTAIMARLLSPRDFGVIAAAWVVIALANVLFDGAFGQNLLRNRTTDRAAVGTTLTIGVVFGTILALCIVVAAPAVGAYFGFPKLASVLTLMSVVVPLKAVFSVATSQLQLQDHFRGMAASTLGAAVVGNFLIGVPLGLMGFGVWALVAAAVATGVAEAALLAWQAGLSFKPVFRRDVAVEVFGAGLFSVANIMNWAANTGANSVVGRTMGEMSLGIYSRGWKLLDLFVAAIATPLCRVLLPGFVKLRDDAARFAAGLEDALWLAVPGYGFISVMFTVHAPLVVRIALGPQWDDTIVVTQLLFAALVPRCTVKITESFLIACGKAKTTIVTQGIYATLMIGGALLGSRHDVQTVALAISVAITGFYCFSLTCAVRLAQIRALTLLSIHLRAVLLAALLTAADLAMLYGLADQHLFVRHVVSGSGTAVLFLGLALALPRYWFGPRNAARLSELLRALRTTVTGRRRGTDLSAGDIA